MTIRTRALLLGCVALAWFSAAVPAGAGQDPAVQSPARKGQRAGAGGAPVVTPLELERWFDSYVLLQAQDQLKLTDAQFPKFLIRLKALQDARRRNLQTRRQIVNTLGKLLKSPPLDEAQAREQLKALRELDARSADELQKAYEGLDEVLDVSQQARFRVFEEVVERRKIDLLIRARQNATIQPRAGGPAVR
jgi:Spy/CpxP family protein refolding chaperone